MSLFRHHQYVHISNDLAGLSSQASHAIAAMQHKQNLNFFMSMLTNDKPFSCWQSIQIKTGAAPLGDY
jgi:hypothetical protein